MKLILPLALLTSLATAIPQDLAALLDTQWGSGTTLIPSDEVITQQTLATLKSLYTNGTTPMSNCQRCKTTLEIGKTLSLTKPSLVSPIFTEWCNEYDILSSSNCKAYFGRNTVHNSSTGTDFANMLQMMDPWGLDGDYFCYFKLSGVCDLPPLPEIDLSSWWPERNESLVAPTPGNETFNVLHISDFHIQLDYTLGAEANATNNGMGCTPHSINSHKKPDSIDNSDIVFHDSYYTDNGTFILGDDVTAEVFNSSIWSPAQEWGSYTCDSPELLINSSLKSIAEFQRENNLTFDFAIFTGDMIDHDELQYTDYNMTIESEEFIIRDMKQYFKDTPVYSVLGNHDTFPYGQLASEASGHVNMYDWNAELMAELWVGAGWLPLDKMEEVKTHYTGFSITTERGLKVIAVNSNTYYQKNMYSYHNMSENFDPFGTLKFIVDELVESEKNGQRVWIIAHIPFVDSDTLPIQAEIYKQIVTRFSPTTIAGLFFGHTHQDQFNVLYANDNKTIDDAIMNTWITQSVTPLSDYNPGWRYYEVDSKTFSIMNSYNYYTQLNETFYDNGDEPVWQFEYSAREAYDPDAEWALSSPLNATFWATVTEKMKTDVDYAQMYSDFSYRLSPFVPQCQDGDCDDMYCYVSSFNVNELNNCSVDSLV